MLGGLPLPRPASRFSRDCNVGSNPGTVCRLFRRLPRSPSWNPLTRDRYLARSEFQKSVPGFPEGGVGVDSAGGPPGIRSDPSDRISQAGNPETTPFGFPSGPGSSDLVPVRPGGNPSLAAGVRGEKGTVLHPSAPALHRRYDRRPSQGIDHPHRAVHGPNQLEERTAKILDPSVRQSAVSAFSVHSGPSV